MVDKHDEASATSEPTANGAGDEAGEIKRLRDEVADGNDRVLRAHAELENYRKRARRELEDERRYAALPMMRDMLPVMDNLQRAIAAAENTPAMAPFVDGIRMVAQSLESLIARHHGKKIDALGKPFDPTLHEAIAQQPAGDNPPHTVLAVAVEGYTLHDRVVRPAQVMVSAGE